MALITYADAVRHCKVAGDDPDVQQDLTLKMIQAEAIVLERLERADHGWTIDANPETDAEFAIVQAAIFEVLLNLWADRGDRERPSVGPLTPRADRMLSQLRGPTVA